jgi:polyisoprenoid-binding protein YceI
MTKKHLWAVTGLTLALAATTAFAQSRGQGTAGAPGRQAPRPVRPPVRADAGAPAADAAAAPTPPPANVVPQPRPTGPTQFEIRPGGMSRVMFQSDAPLETLDGVSVDTQGSFTVNPTAPATGFTGRVAVSVASLRTGSDMRDDHLRGGMWLDAARFPNITLELQRTTLAQPLQPGAEVSGNVTGRFTMHGVTRDVTVPVRVRYVPLAAEHQGMQQFGVNADMIRVRGDFSLNLSDYGVSIIAPLRLKVSNTITVRVDLTAFRR